MGTSGLVQTLYDIDLALSAASVLLMVPVVAILVAAKKKVSERTQPHTGENRWVAVAFDIIIVGAAALTNVAQFTLKLPVLAELSGACALLVIIAWEVSELVKFWRKR